MVWMRFSTHSGRSKRSSSSTFLFFFIYLQHATAISIYLYRPLCIVGETYEHHTYGGSCLTLVSLVGSLVLG